MYRFNFGLLGYVQGNKRQGQVLHNYLKFLAVSFSYVLLGEGFCREKENVATPVLSLFLMDRYKDYRYQSYKLGVV